LTDSGKTPTTDQEKEALQFYTDTQRALHSAGNERAAQIWTAKLNDSESIVNKLLETQHDGFLGIGAGHEKGDLQNSVLKGDPERQLYVNVHRQHRRYVESPMTERVALHKMWTEALYL
jgi:hypothetical protein